MNENNNKRKKEEKKSKKNENGKENVTWTDCYAIAFTDR